MAAYYNEFDPFAAAWLRNLIAAGHIAPGEVDERSILEVNPDDLRGFTQCHFFAGIGVWSHALRSAGWADARPVWTGSCPCQPFSASGKGDEFADERHLWPAFFRLIRECRPVACFGEQVASKDALTWLDHVSTDLEGEGYTFGAVDTCAAGFGAPHIRQRLYWVADSSSARADGGQRIESSARDARRIEPAGRGATGVMAESNDSEWGADGPRWHDCGRKDAGWPQSSGDAEGCRSPCDLGHTASGGRGILGHAACPRNGGHLDRAEFAGVALGDAEFPRLEGFTWNGHDGHGPGRDGAHAAGSTPAPGQLDDRVTLGDADRTSAGNGEIQRSGQLGRTAEDARPGATNGFWAGAEWIACRDGKARPVEPGTSPLAHGATNRVGRLRGYGNAICAPQAEEFVMAFMEVTC